jgi:penicillin-binding protein 2
MRILTLGGRSLFLLIWLLAAVGCGGQALPAEPAAPLSPPTPESVAAATPTATVPAATPLPTPSAAAAPVEAVALAYFRAWEERDYLRMYAALSPQSQASIDSRSFVTFYEEAMRAAAVQLVQSRLLAVEQGDDQAELTVRVTWQTAVVGDIVRDHQVNLVNNQGRWGVVWHEGLLLPELQAGQRLRLVYDGAGRADIYDLNGRPLAYQGEVVTLGVIPGRIANENGLLAALSLVLELRPDEIRAIYAPALPDWYWPVADITGEQFAAHQERLQPHIDAGLTIRRRPARLYPAGSAAAHLIGYTGFIPAEQLERYQAQGYQGDEQIGLAGLEAWGEPYLSGVGGRLTIVDAQGNQLAVVQESAAGGAQAIYTTFDLTLQQAVAEALATAVTSHPDGSAGAVVVLDVATGQVRAMASFPTYDPTVFDGLRLNAATELGVVLGNPRRPLVNRVTQGEYPPGSTFKIVTLAAALNSDLYTPASEYTSVGFWDRLGESFIKYDWLEEGHGTLTLVEALAASCNSCFYDVAYQLNEVNPDLLPQVARQFGLGTPTGINGLPEAAGLIPDPAYKLRVHGLPWEAGDAVNMGIGQGFVLATPLQLAQIMAAIANDGRLLRPTLVDRLGSDEAGLTAWPVEEVGELPLTTESLAALREGLWGVANDELGTAVERFRRLSVPVAGKTGTSEAGGLPHAFFAGYAPAAAYTRADGTLIDQPEIAIVVLMEHVGEGSEVAAPIFRRVVELYYGIQPLTPYPWQR